VVVTPALASSVLPAALNWQNVANDFHGPTYAIAGLIVVGIVAAVVVQVRRHRRAASVAAGQPPARSHRAGRR
jgi:hypothetical protein